MVQLPTRSLSLTDFLAQPETKPASEYHHGRIFQKPMPQGEHSTIQRFLTQLFDSALSPSQIAHAYPELRCNFGDRSIIPDIAIFRWERIPRQDNGRVANRFDLSPDWAIEILSPDQSPTHVTRNILHCLDYGAAMGWLIDSAESCIFTYQPHQTPQYFDQPHQVLPIPSFACPPEQPERCMLTLEQLFNCLVD